MPRRCITAIAFFGYRQRDNFRFRSGHSFNRLMRVNCGCNHPFDGSDHTILTGVFALADDGIQPALRIELPGDHGTTEGNTGNTPIASMQRKHTIRVDGLMSAMKRTDAEVHDARTVTRG